MTKNHLSPIKDIIKDAKKGKMFILVDDKDRENEGDLIIPGSKCNSKNIILWLLMERLDLSSINKK